MTAGRVLLLVPAETYRAADFLTAAHRMGLDVVVGSDGALPLGAGPVLRVHGDDEGPNVDRLVAHAGILDAVVAVDTPMLGLAARVAARLGLPHNSPESIRAASDKAEQRRRWGAAGIPQPAFRVVEARAADEAVALAACEVGPPCVVKPISLSGGRGVLRADDVTAAVAAARRVRGVLTEAGRPDSEALLVEEYVPGRELSVDGLLRDDSLDLIAVFNKPEASSGPTFEETMLVMPPTLPGRVLVAVQETARRAARALGLTVGPIHAELRIRDAGGEFEPLMLEVAARSIGGLCSRALRVPACPSLEELVLADAIGRPLKAPPPSRSAGVLMLHAEAEGVVRAVHGADAAAEVPGVTCVSMTIPLGQRVCPLPEGDRYLGFIFATGATPADVTAALRTARERLDVIVN
jgi:ATP-grasp domain/L-amino acid ligase C-terminal domain 2